MRPLLVALLCTVPLLTSCRHPAWIVRSNNDNLILLERGMTTEQTIALMGQPNFSEMSQTEDGTNQRVLYYWTTYNWTFQHPAIEASTPVVFVDNKLVGYGVSYFDDTQKVDIRQTIDLTSRDETEAAQSDQR